SGWSEEITAQVLARSAPLAHLAQSGTFRVESGWYGPVRSDTGHNRAPSASEYQNRQNPWSEGTFGALTRGFVGGTPNGIRTRAATLRGWCPRPLDDGGGWSLRVGAARL